MARQKKSNKNELDVILEQLKKSYGSESPEMLEDELFKSSESDEDAELNEILGKIFDDDNSASRIESETEDDAFADDPTIIESAELSDESEDDEITAESELDFEDAVASEIVDDNYNTFEADEKTDLIEVVEDTAVKDMESTEELAVDNGEAETEVDNVLFAMLNKKPDESVADEVIELIEESEPEMTDSDEESYAEELPEDVIEDAIDNNGEIDDIVFDEEISMNDETVDLLEAFAVEDEEYDFADESVDEAEIELLSQPSARLVLSEDDYTFDPLQEKLPRYISVIERPIIDDVAKKNESVFEKPAQENKAVDNALNSNDISLLLKLGYDDEVISKVGKEKTQEIMLEKANSFVPEPNKKPYGFCGQELSDRSRLDEIKEKYKSNKRNVIIRLAIVAFLSLIIFSIDVYFEFFSNRISGFPAFILLELTFISLIALTMYKKLFAGLVGILKFDVNSYSFFSFLILFYAIYDIAAIILFFATNASLSASDLMLFGTPLAIYSLLILVTDLLNCIREAKTFDIIASSESIYTAEKQATQKVDKLNMKVDDKAKENTYKIIKTSLVSGYFKKMSRSKITTVNFIYVFGVVPVVSLIVGCSSLLWGGNALRCISLMLLSLIMCIPFSYICIASFTEFVTSSRLRKENIAFVGTEAAEEYSKVNNLIIKDIDTVQITAYTEIHPGKSDNVQQYVEIAKKVFRALGGPLSAIKRDHNGQDSEITSGEIVINGIEDNGIDIYFDSAMNILIGDKHYMHSHNIKVKTDTNLNTATKGVDCSVVYVAFDGVPKLGFIVNSKVRNDFLRIAELMEQSSVHVVVETYEPQINDLYYEQNKGESTANISVIKPIMYDSPSQVQICDGSLISTTGAIGIAKTICESKNIIEQRVKDRHLNILLAVLGGVLACVIMLLTTAIGPSGFVEFLKLHTSLILNVYMISGFIPVIVKVSRLNKKANDKQANNGEK